MTTLSLTEAPAALPEHGQRRWLMDDAAAPKVGDLWVLSWNRSALAMVVVTKVIDDYVLACPVTLPTDPAFAPAVIRVDTPLGVSLTIWPSMETGLGQHLLRRNLGSLLSERTVGLLRRYAEDGEESPLPVADLDYNEAGNPEFFARLLRYMQELCFHEWPSDALELAVISPEVIDQQDASVPFMSQTLGVPLTRARALLLQQASPTDDEVVALARAWHLDPSDFLTASRDDSAETLTEPVFKPLLDQVMAQRGIDEVTARRRAQQEYALAARTARPGDRIARMRAAIERVLRGPDGTA